MPPLPLPDWLARPRQRLPRTITPFHNETVLSFIRRLATANHINFLDLAAYLAGAPKKPLRPEWLAIASGWPLPMLAQRIRGLTTEIRRDTHSGTSCRRCMARRGVFEQVVVCRPRHINVCLRHQLWIGDIYSPESQLDISALPDIASAQRKHTRLVRRHGTDAANSAFADAHRIARRWTERRNWPEHRDRRLNTGFAHRNQRLLNNSIEIDVANYPEVVALTGILVSEYWRGKAERHHDEPNWAPNRDQQKFYAEVRRRLKLDYQPYSSYDPLAAWMEHLRHSYQPQPAQV